MTELIVKMTFWLVAAMLLGGIVGWFASAKSRSKNEQSEDELEVTHFDKNQILEVLEKNLQNEKKRSQSFSDETQKLKKAILEKSNKVKELEYKLKSLSTNVSNQNMNDLGSFDEVIEKAEETIGMLNKKIEFLEEENQKKNKIIGLYHNKIEKLESELKLYKNGRENTEFIISKDQLTKIEEQLNNYQKEISLLSRRKALAS